MLERFKVLDEQFAAELTAAMPPLPKKGKRKKDETRSAVEVLGEELPAAGEVVTSGQSHLADGSPIVVRKPE